MVLKDWFFLGPQAEQEVQSLQRKLKLLENDLEMAEEKAADSTDKLKESETQAEELTRENKQLNHRIDVLEGKGTEKNLGTN